MLTALPLGKSDWIEIARNAPWQATRMNLNTFARHGVFGDEDLRPTSRRLKSRRSSRSGFGIQRLSGRRGHFRTS